MTHKESTSPFDPPTLRVSALDISVFDDPDIRRRALSVMSDDRLAKIGRLRSETAKRLSLAAGVLIDDALVPYGLRLATAGIVTGENGKPGLPEGRLPHLSWSHSGTTAVLAAGDVEVGIDYEAFRGPRRKNLGALVRRTCAESEAAWVLAPGQGSDEARKLLEDRFLRVWTAKEAFLKWLGTGLTRDPRSVEVSVADWHDGDPFWRGRLVDRPDIRLSGLRMPNGIRTLCWAAGPLEG